MAKRKQTKGHYTENKISDKTKPTKNREQNKVLRKGKQFMSISHHTYQLDSNNRQEVQREYHYIYEWLIQEEFHQIQNLDDRLGCEIPHISYRCSILLDNRLLMVPTNHTEYYMYLLQNKLRTLNLEI